MPKKGESKIAPELRARVVSRYCAGESSEALAREYGVSGAVICTLLALHGVPRRGPSGTRGRPRPNLRRFTDPEEARIAARYRAGESAPELAQSLGCEEKTIYQALKRQREPRRSGSAMSALCKDKIGMKATLRQNKEVRHISPARWQELYWTPGWQSVTSLARMFAVTADTIRHYLTAAGISLRTRSEQARVDYRLDRVQVPSAKGRPVPPEYLPRLTERLRTWNRVYAVRLKGRRPHPNMIRGSLAARKVQHPRRVVPCDWCGAPISLTPAQRPSAQVHGCCRSHSGKAWTWRRWHPGKARPLIVDRLRERLANAPYRGLPCTLETLEKAGREIGAADPEYAEVMLRLGP